MKRGGGLLGVLFGAAAGGLFAMLHSKRKGADVRKDLLTAWDKGKSGMDVLWKEIQGMGKEAEESMKEIQEHDATKEHVKTAKKEYKKAKKKALKAIDDAKGKIQDEWEELTDSKEKKRAKSIAKKSKK